MGREAVAYVKEVRLLNRVQKPHEQSPCQKLTIYESYSHLQTWVTCLLLAARWVHQDTRPPHSRHTPCPRACKHAACVEDCKHGEHAACASHLCDRFIRVSDPHALAFLRLALFEVHHLAGKVLTGRQNNGVLHMNKGRQRQMSVLIREAARMLLSMCSDRYCTGSC